MSRSFTDEAGIEHKYVLFVPHELRDDEPPPLIIVLNGRGGNGDDGVRQIGNNFGVTIECSDETREGTA